MSNVAITRCESYDQSLVDAAVKTVCHAALMPPVAGKRVLIKPNILSDAKEEKAITTHSTVVRAVIRLLKEEGASAIYVGDSPGIHTTSFIPRHCGIYEVVLDEGVEWVDFISDPTPTKIPYTRLKGLPIAKIAGEVDLIFSLPKMKTHQLMYATGAVKNLFGLVPNLHKSPMHVAFPTRDQFASLIVGIATVAKPAFSLMDAVIALEGPGPANGTPTHMGLLLASTDPVALDWAEARIMAMILRISRSSGGHQAGPRVAPIHLPAARREIWYVPTSSASPQRTRFVRSLIIPMIFGPIIRRNVKRQRPHRLHARSMHPLRQVRQDLSGRCLDDAGSTYHHR